MDEDQGTVNRYMVGSRRYSLLPFAPPSHPLPIPNSPRSDSPSIGSLDELVDALPDLGLARLSGSGVLSLGVLDVRVGRSIGGVSTSDAVDPRQRRSNQHLTSRWSIKRGVRLSSSVETTVDIASDGIPSPGKCVPCSLQAVAQGFACVATV